MAVKVYIVYYSMYGHVERLAKEILKGVNSEQDVEGTLWQVPETLSTEELARLRAPPKSDVPIITTFKLLEADGFAFGFPTKYLWKTQMLATKPAGIFYSTGYQGGGQETTALTAVTQLVHHGMIYVPIGYTLGPGMKEMKEVKGGSPYGAGTYADDGSREPTELELEQAFHQGNHIATINRVY